MKSLHVKLSSRRVHLLALMDPFVFTKLRIEGAFLQPTELEGKSRPQFLQPCLGLFLLAVLAPIPTFVTTLVGGYQRLVALLKDVSVMSHKDVIALVVKGRHLPTTELGVVREQAAQKSTGTMSQSCGEAIEDQFRYVR